MKTFWAQCIQIYKKSWRTVHIYQCECPSLQLSQNNDKK